MPIETDATFRKGYDLGIRQKRKHDEISSIKARISSARHSVETTRDLLQQDKIDQREADRLIWDDRNSIEDLSRELGRKEVELDIINGEINTFRLDQSYRTTN